MSNNTRKMN